MHSEEQVKCGDEYLIVRWSWQEYFGFSDAGIQFNELVRRERGHVMKKRKNVISSPWEYHTTLQLLRKTSSGASDKSLQVNINTGVWSEG